LDTAVNDIVRVVTVEDQRGIREGLRFFIDDAPGFRCSNVGNRGYPPRPRAPPALELVALTIYEDDDWIFAALCAGGRGTS
jgi:hypothetical protein